MLLIDTYVNQSVIVIHAERKVLPYLFWNLANRYEELRAISDSSSIRGSLTTKMIAAFEIPLANEKSLQEKLQLILDNIRNMWSIKMAKQRFQNLFWIAKRALSLKRL